MYNIKEIFPEGLTPRNNQEDVIKETIKAIENGKRFIVIEAPTGFGKSMVALSLANYYNKVYICCSTNNLQDQYIKDFDEYCDKDWRIMKGRKNYDCKEIIGNTCEEGICRLMKDDHKLCAKYHQTSCESEEKDCSDCSYPKSYCSKGTNTVNIIPGADYICPYHNAKSKFLASDIGIINYDILFQDNVGAQLYKIIKKDVIIMDEAHNLENKLLSFFGLTIKYKDYPIMDYNNFRKRSDTKYNLKDDYNGLIHYLNYVSESVERDLKYNGKKYNIKKRNKLTSLKDKVERMQGYIINHGVSNLVINNLDNNLKLEPLILDQAKGLINASNAKAFVFMSATFLNYKQYFKELGIKPSEIVYIKGNSHYNFRNNNPIHIQYKTGTEYRLNKNNIENPNSKALKELYYNIQSILDQHPYDRGVIHTTSKYIKELIECNITDDRLVFYNNFTKKALVDDFVKNTDNNKVLVSYSHTEGLDLPGDACRFQILCKVPFLDLGDKRTWIKKEQDQEWFNLQAIRTIIQTVGRGYRYADDYCVNYILDNNYQWLVRNRNAKRLRQQTKF